MIGIKNTMSKKKQEDNLALRAIDIRKNILEMMLKTQNSHIGSCYSIVDILTVLYFRILNIDPKNSNDSNRDIFVLSKGHAAAALYAVLAARNFFSMEELYNFCVDGSKIAGHVVKNSLPGIEISSGSLGHGLSMTTGMALANKKKNRHFYCLLGDGECNEGSNWEAMMFAVQQKLHNLIAIVDLNKQQGMGRTEGIVEINNMKDRWKVFGWNAVEVDGHNYTEIENAFKNLQNSNKPSVIIANTIKGKGVSYMEDDVTWHYSSPTNDTYIQALKELDKQYEKYSS